MNYKVFSLLIISTMFASFANLTVGQNAAMAQNRGARFTFAPNVYRIESHPRAPRSSWSGPQPQHQVAHGAVPHGSSFLGVDPAFLKKQAPPQVAHSPLIKPTTSAVIRAPKTNATYKKHFGEPQALVAHQPPALSIPKTASKKVSSKVVSPKRSSQRVSAKRVRKSSPRAHIAKANSIKGYGNSGLYTPGGHTPTSTGSSTQTNVRGEVLTHTRHR